MNAPVRTFEIKEAARQQVPVFVGISGASGSGKTFSALRLATGMQKHCGGDIAVIDTESKRALHYADRFKFKHVEFVAPFGSLDYLAVITHVVKQGHRNIVIDSASHEHEGVGGYLSTHAKELERLGNDPKNNFTAWIKPARERRELINGLLQLNANFIFCFRAKDKLKIVGGGKPVELGFMPIAGDEFVYEMTLSALLYPGARGVPTWNSTLPGERTMIKLPEQFRNMFAEGNVPLDEEAGRLLAEWAAGGEPSTPTQHQGDTLFVEGKRIAAGGTKEFVKWWNLPAIKKQWPALRVMLDEFKAIANAADEAPAPADDDPFGLPPTGQGVPVLGTTPVDDDAARTVEEGNAAEEAAANAREASRELCDRLISALPSITDAARLKEYKAESKDEIATTLRGDDLGRWNTAFIERQQQLAARK
jgi:ABC-type dipeptide/oligopeptide/nickel transport system ATPase subunit